MKSIQLDGEPVVLLRLPPEAAPEPESTVAEPLPADGTADPPALEPTWLTYEEYKQRFEAELAAVEQETRERGLARGREEGFEQIKSEYAEQIEALARLIASLREALDQGIDASSEGTVAVVCEAVIKVFGEALVDREAVIAVVRQVIRRTKERTKLVVRVSPADWSILEGNEAALVEGLSVDAVELFADDRVQVGGCLLETPAGNLDGRLEVQLAGLREALVNARAAESEGETVA